MIIRGFRPGDEAAAYEVCLRTGDSGEDATEHYADPLLLGHVYVGPYLRLAPEYAFMLTDGDAVVGYVLGVPDTLDFERRCEARWWPPLRERYPEPPGPPSTPDERMIALIHHPERTPPEHAARYPAHLHIDLLPVAQGSGNGRRMMEHLLGRLAAAGVPAVHLGVDAGNERAIAFYERLGFVAFDTEPDGILMGRSLR